MQSRDAIIAAVLLPTTGGFTDRCMIWGVFAERGLRLKCFSRKRSRGVVWTPRSGSKTLMFLLDCTATFKY
ncbi:hypothetical protein [Halpernia sp. GG3]